MTETFVQYQDVFGEAMNRQVYQLAVSKRNLFTRSKTSPSRHYSDWRRSTVLYDDALAGATSRLTDAIHARLPQVLKLLGIPPFEIGGIEVQLTSHQRGEYYHWHKDNSSPETASRIVTFVYYFHSEPRHYTGGELVIYSSDGQSIVIEPVNDTLVFFDSGTKHEVKPVRSATARFEHGRFTLNGWIRKRTADRLGIYFDQKILTLPRQWREQAVVAGPRPATRPAWAGMTPMRRELPRDDATHEIDSKPQNTKELQATALLRLYSDLHRQSSRARRIDILSTISGTEFFENYYYLNRPLLLKGSLKTSPALRKWSPEFFGENYGSVEVQITTGRGADPSYEQNFSRTVQNVTLSEFVRRLIHEPETNDFYLVARNYFFDNPALRPLRGDVRPPDDIINIADRGTGTMKLWFGPKGTVTPLHFDQHSILFAQIFGRKHFKLMPSFDTPKMYVHHRFYSAVDPQRVDAGRYPAFLDANVIDVVVEPGDLLFLPVGWWHWAKSLEISISVTFCSFRVRGRNTQLSLQPDLYQSLGPLI